MSEAIVNKDGVWIVETRRPRTYPVGNMGLAYSGAAQADQNVNGIILTYDGFIKSDAVKNIRVNNQHKGNARSQIVFSVKSVIVSGSETDNPLAVMDDDLRTFCIIYPGQTVGFESDAAFRVNSVTGNCLFTVGELYLIP